MRLSLQRGTAYSVLKKNIQLLLHYVNCMVINHYQFLPNPLYIQIYIKES